MQLSDIDTSNNPEAAAMLDALQTELYIINDIAANAGPARIGGMNKDNEGERD